MVMRQGRHGWVWPDVASLPPPTTPFDSSTRAPEYERLMAGVSVADTLHQVGAIVAFVSGLLVPPRP
jgi:hypothetical protein